MYALQKRKAEWEVKNEILLGHMKARVSAVAHDVYATVARVLSFVFFLLWRIGRGAIKVIGAIFQPVKMVREVGPGVEPEEILPPARLYEQGPMVR